MKMKMKMKIVNQRIKLKKEQNSYNSIESIQFHYYKLEYFVIQRVCCDVVVVGMINHMKYAFHYQSYIS